MTEPALARGFGKRPWTCVIVGGAPAEFAHKPLVGAFMDLLCTLGDFSVQTYYRTFDRCNLIEGPNRDGMIRLLPRLDARDVLMVGRSVAKRFYVLNDLPFLQWRDIGSWCRRVAIMPHTSGDWWNEPGNTLDLGEFLLEIIADVNKRRRTHAEEERHCKA